MLWHTELWRFSDSHCCQSLMQCSFDDSYRLSYQNSLSLYADDTGLANWTFYPMSLQLNFEFFPSLQMAVFWLRQKYLFSSRLDVLSYSLILALFSRKLILGFSFFTNTHTQQQANDVWYSHGMSGRGRVRGLTDLCKLSNFCFNDALNTACLFCSCCSTSKKKDVCKFFNLYELNDFLLSLQCMYLYF